MRLSKRTYTDLSSDFLLLFLFLGCITNQSGIPFLCPSAASTEALGSSAMFYGVNIVEVVVGEGVREYHNSQCRGTPGGLVE